MRKFLISAALAASTLAIAAPAAAQWAPSYGVQYGGQYGAPYGNAYGYNYYGQVRSLMVRVNRLEQQINQLDRRNILSDREADRLRNQANRIEWQLRQSSRNGFNRYEQREIEFRIARLEQNIRIQAADGNRWGNRGYNSYGYNDRDRDYRFDRDRDGRDDRYEDDQGRDRDD
jgi:opacity protein-like surface antigen